MKYLLIFLIAVLCLQHAFCQDKDISAKQVAEKIATKLFDSLHLNAVQRSQVYSINMQLYQLKGSARERYAESDSLVSVSQKIENTRDSLYSKVLTGVQFLNYAGKKRNLVNND